MCAQDNFLCERNGRRPEEEEKHSEITVTQFIHCCFFDHALYARNTFFVEQTTHCFLRSCFSRQSILAEAFSLFFLLQKHDQKVKWAMIPV